MVANKGNMVTSLGGGRSGVYFHSPFYITLSSSEGRGHSFVVLSGVLLIYVLAYAEIQKP